MNYAIALILVNVSVLAGWSAFTGENGFAELGKFFRGEPAFIVTPKLTPGSGGGGSFTEGPKQTPGQGGGGGGAW